MDSNPLNRRFVTLSLAVSAGLLAAGLGAPRAAWAAESIRAVTGYQAVVLEGSTNVKVELAERESVRVSGPSDTAVESIETVVEPRGGLQTLVVRQKSSGWSWSWRKSEATVTVTVAGPRFESLSVAGSGDLEARLSNQPTLRVSVAGSGDVRVQGVTAHRIDVNVAGSGDVKVQGAAQTLHVNVAGSGDAWLRELEAEDVKVSVAGSGDARVNARQRLRASVAGSGDVRYIGPATDVSSSVSGSGTVARDPR